MLLREARPLLAAGPAFAANRPGSVVGSRPAQANQNAPTLRITSQAAGAGRVAIGGTIADVAPGGRSNKIQGRFCPSSGRISFLRRNTATNDAFQVCSGNVSMSGAHLYTGGVSAEESQAGNLGEHSFSARK